MSEKTVLQEMIEHRDYESSLDTFGAASPFLSEAIEEIQSRDSTIVSLERQLHNLKHNKIAPRITTKRKRPAVATG